MNEYGTILRITREKLGITLEKASQDTKISVQKLIALETMQKESFPAETYLKGTLMLYARYLRLDPSKVLELLELNAMHEKPVEFDLISLQQNKKKKRKKILSRLSFLFIVVSLLAIVIFYREQIVVMIQDVIPTQDVKEEVSVENLEQIGGLYERIFSEGEEVAIVGSSLTRKFTIVSVDDAVVTIGSNTLQLERNVPNQIDVDNDGSIDYLLIMREQNKEDATLLIRIDPRVNNQDLVNGNFQLQSEFPSIDSDAEIENILVTKNREPIKISLDFTAETFFRIVSNNAVVVEKRSLNNESYVTTVQDQGTVYLSNDANVTIFINDIALNISKNALPFVFDLLWVTEQSNEVLKFVPRP